MATINKDGLTPMQRGRLDNALAGLIRVDGVVMTWEASILPLSGRKRIGDDMARYSRARFNRMGYREQEAYMARLSSKRVYSLAVTIAGYDGDAWREVPKIIYDAVMMDPAPGEAEAEAAWTDADSLALFGSV